MITTIENLKESYANGKVTVSGTVQIAEGAEILWEKGITSKSVYVDSPAGWYPKIKTDLLAQAQDVQDVYISRMTQILTETGKHTVAEIIADIKNHIEEGLV